MRKEAPRLRPRVRFVVRRLQPFHRHVRVDLRGREAGVAEEGLDAAEVGAGVEQVGGEGVAEFVRADAGGDAGVVEVALQQRPDGDGAHPLANTRDEKGAVFDAGGLAVDLDRLQRWRTDGNDALLAALAEDADALGVGIDALHIERAELGEAQAAGVEELQHRGIAHGHPGRGLGGLFHAERRAEQLIDLRRREDDRKLALELWQLHRRQRIYREPVALAEVAVEGAQRREVEADRRPRQPAFADGEEVAAKVIRRQFQPLAFFVFAKFGERVGVVRERAFGGVFLDVEVAQELRGKRVGFHLRPRLLVAGRLRIRTRALARTRNLPPPRRARFHG